jgi:hypothetical protein
VLGKLPSSSHGAGDERSRGCDGGSNGGWRQIVGKGDGLSVRGQPAFRGKELPGDVAVMPEMRP